MAFKILDERDVISLNKNYSNALKGNLKGAVVRADDVAPNEHQPSVNVKSINLIPYPYLNDTKTTGELTYTAQSDGGIAISGTLSTSFAGFSIYKGVALAKTGYISISLSGEYEGVYLRIDIKDADGNVLIAGGTNENGAIINLDNYPTAENWDILLRNKDGASTFSGIAYPQIEEGASATDYTPYVDPSTVTLTKAGKNLIPFPYASKTQNYNGIVFTPNADGSVTINGTTTSDGISFMLVNTGAGSREFLPAGTYYLSCPEISTNTDVYLSLFYYDNNETTTFAGTSGKNSVVTLEEGKYYGLYFRVYGGVTVNNLTVHPQLELGNSATDYEQYKGENYTPASDGIVEIEAVSPTMTLLTDKIGAVIECEYNKDVNNIIEKLTNAIIDLGGTV